MDHMEQQDEFNLNISPAAVAFVVLAVVMGLVGLYVTSQDINTSGVTADEARLPLNINNTETGISVSYPEDWRATVEGGRLVLQPRAEGDDIVRVELEHRFANPATVLAAVDGVNVEPETLENDALNGQTFTTTAVINGEPVDVRYTAFETDFGDTFLATLTTTEGNLDEYERDFELMLGTVEYALSLTRTAARPETRLAVTYPRTWTDQRDLQLPERITIVETADDPNSNFFRFDVVPAQTFNLTGNEPDAARQIAAQLVETPGVTRLGDYVPIVYQRYAGVQTSIQPEGDDTQQVQVTVLDLGEGNYMVALAFASSDRFAQLTAILEEMLRRLEYSAFVSPVERLNNVRANATPTEPETPTEETPPAADDAEAEDTAEADTDTDTPAETTSPTDRVNDIRDTSDEEADTADPETTDEDSATTDEDIAEGAAETTEEEAVDEETGAPADEELSGTEGDTSEAAADEETDAADEPADEDTAEGDADMDATVTDRVNEIRDTEDADAPANDETTSETEASEADVESENETTDDAASADDEAAAEAETSAEPLPLGDLITRDAIGLAVAAPEDWTDQRDPQLPTRITLVETPNDPTTNFYRFDVVPAEAFGLTGAEEDPTQAVAAVIVEAPGITRLTDYTAISRAGFEGVETEIQPEGDTSQQAHVLVLELPDDTYLIVLLLAETSVYEQLDATLDAMLETLEYDPVEVLPEEEG